MLQIFVFIPFAALITGLLGGFLGAIHPALDTLSNFRLHLTVLAVIFAIIAWQRMSLFSNLAAFLILGYALVTVLPSLPLANSVANSHARSPTGESLRLVHFNLFNDNSRKQVVLERIGQIKPDLFLVNEYSVSWQEVEPRLVEQFPFLHHCDGKAHIGGTAIFSRHQIVPQSVECHLDGAMAMATIRVAGTPVRVAAIHLSWPWPFEGYHQARQLSDILGALEEPLLVAGDFNSVPWSHLLQDFSRRSATSMAQWRGATWLPDFMPDILKGSVGFPIDNVLGNEGISFNSVHALPAMGSDHLPVYADFSINSGKN